MEQFYADQKLFQCSRMEFDNKLPILMIDGDGDGDNDSTG